jgi:1,4-alpha-glucan branching enzyme
MSVTPPLAAMLKDDLLRARFDDHLRRLETLAEKEMVRLYGNRDFAPLATFYRHELARIRRIWDRHHGDVIAGLVRHWDEGRIELLTCSASHCYLPGMLPAREGIRPQLELGVRAFEKIVGRTPKGAWLAECAYHPSFDEEIARAGIRFTVLDTHGVLLARPRPPFGVHAPIASPSGVAFFARDIESSRQVWSRQEGYPGDFYYRDFYRDIGFDLPESELHGEVGPNGTRVMTGLKYHRITGKTDHKEPYIPHVAEGRARDHAAHFARSRIEQVRGLADTIPHPIVVAPYDAELFGHWWFEGPMFLEHVFRELHLQNGGVTPITLRGYLDRYPVLVNATPAGTSWGAGGYGEVWVGPEAGWSWRHVHHATRYAKFLIGKHKNDQGDRGRALDQMIRELLLLQSSDWNFIIKTGTSMKYAEARIRAHVHRLRHLGHLVETGIIEGEDRQWLDDVAARDNFLWQLPSETLRSVFVS